MDQAPSFEHMLESDIAQLAEQVKNLRELPEMQSASEAEILKQAIRAFPNPAPQPVPVPTPPAASSGVLPDYAADVSPEVKLEIEYLVDVALRQGIGKALAEARDSSPFVEDAVRDTLAGKLYPELQKRGIVQ